MNADNHTSRWHFLPNVQGVFFLLIFYSVTLSVFCLTVKFSLLKYSAVPFYLCLCPYCLLLSLALAAHVLCSFSDPGFIPYAYLTLDLGRVPEADRFTFQLYSPAGDSKETQVYYMLEDMPLLEQQRAAALSETIRKVCNLCNCVKPPNAHHCTTCGRCIIRLDHHCPWINNCVAYYTQRPFIQMLIYCELFAIYSGILQLIEAYRELGFKGAATIEEQSLCIVGVGNSFCGDIYDGNTGTVRAGDYDGSVSYIGE
eukprot:TRINITY_DN7998_c0_g4_i3.p1 TRINITY_DN7998_c0_g4~~TRINITY_DN7998_c0_g4_i3.p1  ORF type:complete len:256 (-),score=27.38 TRINITY_DN7998_c0_g4_i3:288-1055(-)